MVDVGANDGPYASELRRSGFAGRIVSFGPGSSAFDRLSQRAARDNKWDAHRLAIGARRGGATLNVTGNSSSSSLLALNDLHVEVEPTSAVVATEEVEVAPLDELGVLRPGERALVKLDVPGYELEVLRGAEQTLRSVRSGRHGALARPALCRRAAPRRPRLVPGGTRLSSCTGSIRCSTTRVTAPLLQVDGLFVRG